MSNSSREPRELPYLQGYLVDEMIEDYREDHLSRREMIRRVLLITGSVPATAALLLAAGCGPSGSSAAPTQTSAATASVSAPAGGATTPAPTTAQAARAASTPAGTAISASTTGATPTAAVSQAATAPTAGATGTSASSGATPSPTRVPASVSEGDPAIAAAAIQFPGQVGTLKGYQAAPKGVAKAPGILVIHENRGLTEHIKDVTRRYAKAGYLAVAPDLVSRQGGTDQFSDSAQITGILGQAKQADLVQDLLSGVAYLKGLPAFAGPKAGIVGFCFGGGLTWLLAINSSDLAAAVPYYGPPPPNLDDVQKITAAVLAFYGGLDTRITSNEPKIAEAMQKYRKVFEYKIYPGASHAFNNDTGASYNDAAATDAFRRAQDWFANYLRA